MDNFEMPAHAVVDARVDELTHRVDELIARVDELREQLDMLTVTVAKMIGLVTAPAPEPRL